MAEHKTWRQLRAEIITTAERDADVKAGAAGMVLESRLYELRQRRALSQRDVADQIGVSQARISDIEHAEDMQVTTLAKYIAGLGGTLHVQAVFPDEVCDLTA